MSRRKRKTPRGRAEASKKAQSGGLRADSRLVKLLETSLLLPGEQIITLPDGRFAVGEDQWLVALAIRDRCRELGGEPKTHLHRALEYMAQRGRA